MKALYLILGALSFVLTNAGLQIDWQYVAVALGGAIAGSLVLGYIRPEVTFWRQAIKGCIATIVGLIFGAAVVEYQAIDRPAFIGLSFFITSLLALILIRTLVGLFEANAGSLTVTLVQRIFNIKLDRTDDVEKVRARARRRDIKITRNAGDDPTVEIGKHARPDEVRVIEQTVVKQSHSKEG